MSQTDTLSATPRFSVSTALLNPSWYVAGGPALGLGLALILLGGLIGSFGSTHFDGVLDYHTGRPAPLWLFLAEGVIDWLALAVLLYTAGRMLSRSHHLRAIDVFGTQALARAPYLLVALTTLLPGYQRSIARSIENLRQIAAGNAGSITSMSGNSIDFSVFLAVGLFNLVMLIWMVALMYRAYANSCNLKGTRAVVSFIAAVLVAEIISKVAVIALVPR